MRVNKSKLLVVSHNIPRQDRSSGELRLVAILDLLSNYWDIDFCIAPSHTKWIKISENKEYIDELNKNGIQVLQIEEASFQKAIDKTHYSGIYINMFWIAEEVMQIFKNKQAHAFTVVDSVDVHYAREESQAKIGEIEYSQALKTKERELGIYKAADITIAVSKDDFQLLSKTENVGNVVLVPNIVTVYKRKKHKRLPKIIFIGSYSWYPNLSAVKWFATDIWPTVLKAVPKADFLIIGSDPTEDVLALNKIKGIEVVGYVPKTKPYYDFAAVSIAPMLVGGGMKGKVNEALAHGVPVVATTIGAQGFAVNNGVNMMVSDHASEFATCIIKLLTDDELQYKIGIAGQELNSSICSKETVSLRIKELYDLSKSVVINKQQSPLLDEKIVINSSKVITSYGLIKPERILSFPILLDPPVVSIIIPVYNEWQYTHACLYSILNNSTNINYEVIIADDNSTDETQSINNYIKNIKVVRNKKNKGFLHNCNDASLFANGKYIIFLNNDTLVQPNWLFHLIKTMDEDPSIGLTGSKLIFSTGKLQEAGGIVFKDGSAMNYGREDSPDKPEYNYLKDVDYCTGACICIRKNLWDITKGFDPLFAPAYYEDTDLAMQIRSMGYRVVYQPKSEVVHFEGMSHGTDLNSGIKKKQVENQKKFYLKWENELQYSNFHRDENLFKAREKSKHKLAILLIDYRLPSHNNTESDKKSFKMINDYFDMGFSIKILPDDFIRRRNTTDDLEQKGIEILYNDWYKDNWENWLSEHAQQFNAVCFVDESIASKYLSKFQAIFKDNLNMHIYNMVNNYNVESNKVVNDLKKELDVDKKHMLFEPGHFFSPIVDIQEVKKNENEIWGEMGTNSIKDIKLNESFQLGLIEAFSEYYKNIPFPSSKNQHSNYFYENEKFSYTDAIFLYSFIRHFNPINIIEIGSGFSTAAIIDSLNSLKRKKTKLCLIDTNTIQTNSIVNIKENDQVKIYEKRIQQVEPTFFLDLNENDFLFLDSSHVSKTGSDVNYIIFNILPQLKKGVIIHFHDIFYPFEYPKDWVIEGRNWNEIYLLRSFLMNNDNYKILLFPHFIHSKHSKTLEQMPDCYKNWGGSFWIQKVK